MPDTTRIPRERLAEYFDEFSKRIMANQAPEGFDAEIVSPDIGHQESMHGARLEGITYDPTSDTLEIALDVGDHRVVRPQEVWVTESSKGFPTSLEVVHSDGTREIISVRPGASHRLPPADAP